MTESKGRKPIISEDEEELIKREIKEEKSLDFLIDKIMVRHIMGIDFSEGRKDYWKNGIPSPATICLLKERTRDITVRKAKNKEFTKLKAETYEHAKNFFDAML